MTSYHRLLHAAFSLYGLKKTLNINTYYFRSDALELEIASGLGLVLWLTFLVS